MTVVAFPRTGCPACAATSREQCRLSRCRWDPLPQATPRRALFDAVAVTRLDVRDGGQTLFVLRLPHGKHDAAAVERVLATWRECWRQAGREAPPSVLIIEAGVHLWASGDEAGDCGVMRVERE